MAPTEVDHIKMGDHRYKTVWASESVFVPVAVCKVFHRASAPVVNCSSVLTGFVTSGVKAVFLMMSWALRRPQVALNLSQTPPPPFL